MKHTLFLIATALVSFSAHAIKPTKTYIRYPQQMGLIYKSLDVKTPDDYQIETWYFPAQEMPEENSGQDSLLPYKTLDQEKRPTLIICDADSGNMSYYQLTLAMYYTANGYNVVTFDWRGFGASSKFAMDNDYFCYTEMLTDYNAVIAEVARQPETDSGGIYLFGWSTGGYLSMIAAHRNHTIKGCILRGIPTSFEAVIPIIKRETGKTDGNVLVPNDFPLNTMPLALAPGFHKDIMLVVGSEDTRTPPQMSWEVFNKLPDHIDKRIWIAKGAKHGGQEAPEFLFPDEFISRTCQFMDDSQRGK